MPKPSAFNPAGMLRCSSRPSDATRIYDAIVASLGGDGQNYAIEPGTREDATAYAQAMGIARERLTLQAAGNQMLPAYLSQLLPNREDEYGLVPGPKETIAQRRAAVAAARLLPLGAAQIVIESALKALLGADFVAYRPTPVSEAVAWPTNLGDQPMNLQTPSTPRKLIRLTAPVAATGVQSVTYAPIVIPTAPNALPLPLLAGDVLVIDVANDAQSEVVGVTAVGVGTFTANFLNSHDNGAVGTTGSWPMWTSTKRFSIIILSALAAGNVETRRKVNNLLAKLSRGVSTWNITSGGPFILDQSDLDETTFIAIP